MEVPRDLGKCKQYPKDSCVASEYQPNTSSKKPSMTSQCWGTIQFSVYCPNWETLRAKEVPWITMLNNGHRPGLSQGIRLCGQPTSRQSWPLSSLNSQSTSVCSLHSVCLRVSSRTCLRISQRRGQAFSTCITSVSPGPGTEMTPSVINESRCLFNKLSE